MAEEQRSPAGKKKLPIKTKVTAWLLIILASIFGLLSIVFSFATGCSANTDISMFSVFGVIGLGISVGYSLLGILLLNSRHVWAWILSVIILCLGILIPFVFMLRDVFAAVHLGLPPEDLLVRHGNVYFLISCLILLILVLPDRVSYKFVIPIPVILTIMFLGCFYSVRSDLGSYRDQAIDFETRMYTELPDLYVQAVEDRDTKWCQGCEEVNQYFNEQWNQLDPNVREQSYYNIENGRRYRACLEAIAYLTENVSVCSCVGEIEGSKWHGGDFEQCKKLVQGLAANNISVCKEDYEWSEWRRECTSIFAIMTNNSSLCDQIKYSSGSVDSCHAAYDRAQEDPYNYLGWYWHLPGE